MTPKATSEHHQQGAALLLILLIVIVGASAVLASQLSSRSQAFDRLAESRATLAQAKQALVDYASTYSDLNPGAPLQLPCPDLDAGGAFAEGEAHTSACGGAGVTAIGRFPWRTLGVAPPRDASGSCLWYAVSGAYKGAGSATVNMINPDSNGQMQLFSADTGALLEGLRPDERPVAILLAPMDTLAGQTRSGVGSPGTLCGTGFSAADYLDADSGISNAVVAGVPDAIDSFAMRTVASDQHNDQLLSVTRSELARAVYDRPDFAARVAGLTRGIASCVAAYGQQNPGGPGDRRLPWPAPVALADYADITGYDDRNDGVFSGRLPDNVGDSSATTGNPVVRLLGDCDPALAPDWDPALLSEWQHWKDHFFYAVADAYQPGAVAPSACGDCVSVNGAGAFAAIVWFGGPRLPLLAQRRDAPPIDADTKQDITNYLEGRNAVNHPYTGGLADFESRAAAPDFNDIAFCVDASLAVSVC